MAAKTFALRVKTKSGQAVLKSLTPQNTIKDLKVQLATEFSIPEHRLHVLSGFPPKVLDITQDSLSLDKSGLTSGDTLILEEKTNNNPSQPPKPQKTLAEPPAPPPSNSSESEGGQRGVLMKQVVPADNSCLFSSIFFVLNGKIDESGTAAPWMRQIIAETVSKDSDNFSEAILGKPNAEYCAWIQQDNSWGGAIELAILSNYYGMEIAVVDTINAIINRFGEDQQYALRVFLLFDGIHYDPLFLEPFDGGNPQTIFPAEDENVMKDAQMLAQEAKSSRQFTDVNKFTLKCLNCNIFLSGQVQAREHAQSTGHTNFGEV